MKNTNKKKSKSSFVFDSISGLYSLFYKKQRKKFQSALDTTKAKFDVSKYNTALDIGCGTGALCSVLSSKGIHMTGVDNSIKMLSIAKKKNSDSNINFLYYDALEKLPFGNDSFDFSIASYVAHGLKPEERKKVFREMKRVSKHYVILHEYNKKRKIVADIIEWLEGGNYFDFIKTIEGELKEIFGNVKIIDVSETGSWYICEV